MADKDKYTVTINTAAPGTPLHDADGSPKLRHDSTPQTSLPGHAFYVTNKNGHEPRSFGFAPIKEGDIDGPGEISGGDQKHYNNPLYSRTMEVTKEQYEKLNEFGKNPDKYGFSKEYKDIRNNCVDFTWGGLNHAGIQRQDKHFWQSETHGVDGKSAYKPTRNIDGIKSIQAPIPDSPLNKEETNAMPPRGLMQRLLTEQEQQRNSIAAASSLPANASLKEVNDHAFAVLMADDPVVREAGMNAVINTRIGQDFQQQSQQAVLADNAQLAQLAAAQQTVQNNQQVSSPVMRM